MRLRTHEVYPAGPEAVLAVFTDPAFVAEKAERMSVADHSSEVVHQGDRTIVRSKRTLPTAEMPDIARRVVGEVLTLIEEQNWGPAKPDGSHEGTISLKVQGAPVSVVGTLKLLPSASGAVQDLDAELVAKVPLMGGAIERAAAPAIEAGIDFEAAMVTEWLTRG